MARQRPVHLNGLQLFSLSVATVVVLILAVLFTYHSVFVYGARQGWPVVTPIVELIASKERRIQERYLKENLELMAKKLGELQARQVQLDALGERVASLAGVPMGDIPARKPMGIGGALILPDDVSIDSLKAAMEAMDAYTQDQSDQLGYIESRLFSERMRKYMLPTSEPVPGVVTGSGFGWRVDPFTGQKALHTGLDFPAETGTPILAAAGGVVVTEEMHPAYGHMVEIDHGNNLITRYAHASKVLVKKGDIVKRGQPIAEVGTTGRSTGPHLHFEVWHAGAAQNPQAFLSANTGDGLKMAGSGRAPSAQPLGR